MLQVGTQFLRVDILFNIFTRMVANDAGWLFNFEQDQYRPAAPVFSYCRKELVVPFLSRARWIGFGFVGVSLLE